MLAKIGIHTPKLFKRVNDERVKNQQRPFEERAMAIVFSMAFTAITKRWIDFKKEFIDIEEEQAEIIEKICRENFNVNLPGVIEELGLIAMRPALFEKLRNQQKEK